MMGYTHMAIGAAGAVSIAAGCFDATPELFLVSSVAGAIGGVVVDIDSKDHKENPRVTDAGRTRLAVLGLFVLGIILDLVFGCGILFSIISREYYAIGGVIGFLVFLMIGRSSEHRTFSHSL